MLAMVSLVFAGALFTFGGRSMHRARVTADQHGVAHQESDQQLMHGRATYRIAADPSLAGPDPTVAQP